jgi:hypothetical protein
MVEYLIAWVIAAAVMLVLWNRLPPGKSRDADHPEWRDNDE